MSIEQAIWVNEYKPSIWSTWLNHWWINFWWLFWYKLAFI